MGSLGHDAHDLTGVAGDPGSGVHRRDPRAKVLGLLGVTVVAVSASPDQWPVWVACAAVLAAVAAIGRVPPAALWRRTRIVLAPVLVVAAVVPLVRRGGAEHALGPLTVHEAGLLVLASVAAKATLGALAAALLACTTPFPATLRGLEALRVPHTLTLIAGLMFRYLFVLVADVGRVRNALAARAYRPRSALQAGALGRVATSLFLRAHARGERVHLAMVARGYSARERRTPALEPLAFGTADALLLAAVAAALLPLRVVVA